MIFSSACHSGLHSNSTLKGAGPINYSRADDVQFIQLIRACSYAAADCPDAFNSAVFSSMAV